MSAITSSPVLSRSATPQDGSCFKVTRCNKAHSATRIVRADLDMAAQVNLRTEEKRDSVDNWSSAEQKKCDFVSARDEAWVLKTLVSEGNRFQQRHGSTKLQQALTARTQNHNFKVDEVSAGVSPKVLAELLKDLDIVMGLCQEDKKCRSPYQSTKKSLSSLPLWEVNA